jgi:hypothetical protein
VEKKILWWESTKKWRKRFQAEGNTKKAQENVLVGEAKKRR